MLRGDYDEAEGQPEDRRRLAERILRGVRGLSLAKSSLQPSPHHEDTVGDSPQSAYPVSEVTVVDAWAGGRVRQTLDLVGRPWAHSRPAPRFRWSKAR